MEAEFRSEISWISSVVAALVHLHRLGVNHLRPITHCVLHTNGSTIDSEVAIRRRIRADHRACQVRSRWHHWGTRKDEQEEVACWHLQPGQSRHFCDLSAGQHRDSELALFLPTDL